MLFEDQTKGQDGNQTQQTQTQEDWLAKIVEVKGEAFKDPQVLEGLPLTPCWNSLLPTLT